MSSGSGEVREPAGAAGQPAAGEPAAGGAAEQPAEGGEATSSAVEEHHVRRRRDQSPNMLPGRPQRRFGLERLLVRLVATAGIIGIGVLIGAILGANKVQGWITGLVIAAVSVVLSAILWSSRQM